MGFREGENVFVKIPYLPTLDTFRCLKIKEYHKGEYKLYSLEPVWDNDLKTYEYSRERESTWVAPERLVRIEDVIPALDDIYGVISSKKNAFIYYKYVEWLKSIGVTKTSYELAIEIVTENMRLKGKSEEYIREILSMVKSADIVKGKPYVVLKSIE